MPAYSPGHALRSPRLPGHRRHCLQRRPHCDGRIDEDCLGTNCFDDDDTFAAEQAYTLLVDRTGIFTLTPFSKYQGQTGLYTVTATATWD